MTVDAAQRKRIADARRYIPPGCQVHVMAPPCIPPLAHGEVLCTEDLTELGGTVVYHARTVDEGAGLHRCIDCGYTSGTGPKT